MSHAQVVNYKDHSYYAMIVKLLGERPPAGVNLYDYIAEECTLDRQEIKFLLLAKMYNVKTSAVLERVPDYYIGTILKRFPGLEHLLK